MRKEDFRPRLLVWQLTEDRSTGAAVDPAGPPLFSNEFATSECMLTIDSIARTSKPIVVLTGPAVLARPDLFGLVQYSFALGLKVIVEATPDEITEDLLLKFSRFGRRVFRILIDGCVREGTDSRYDDSPGFRSLEACVARMRTAGYEIHLGMTLGSLEAREIAFLHDYAFRRSAEGLYFHLDWSGEEPPGAGETAGAGEAGRNGHESAALLETIAAIKQSSPRGMFFSPQCVRYARRESGCDACAADGVAGLVTRTEWCASCVGGKTFAYIGPAGTVQVCKEIPVGSGSLRSNGYDFKALWEETTLFADLRTRSLGCAETRGRITDAHAAAAGECAA